MEIHIPLVSLSVDFFLILYNPSIFIYIPLNTAPFSGEGPCLTGSKV